MSPGDPDPEHPGPDPEAQRRLERHRLAIDPGRDRPIGVNLEVRGGPFAPGMLDRASQARRGGRQDGYTEQPVVYPGTRPRPDGAAKP
jgi:hypothetical protein